MDASFRHNFDDQESSVIELVLRTMYWANQTSNSVDALLARLRRAPVSGSTRSTEFAALLLYAVTVPVRLLWLSVRQRRNPISMFRGIRPFFREFEARGPDTISGRGVRYSGPELEAVSPG